MNTFRSNTNEKHSRSRASGPRSKPALAAVMLATLALGSPAYADHTCAWGELVPGGVGATCASAICSDVVGEVFFEASAYDCDPSCTVTPTVVLTLDECYTNATIDSVALYAAEVGCTVDQCDVTGPGTDLLAGGPFAFNATQWSALVDGDSYTVIAMIDTDSNGLIERAVSCILKHTGNCPEETAVPTISEWGLLALIGLVITAGAIMMGRPRATGA